VSIAAIGGIRLDMEIPTRAPSCLDYTVGMIKDEKDIAYPGLVRFALFLVAIGCN
jgi:hypothetical protein